MLFSAIVFLGAVCLSWFQATGRSESVQLAVKESSVAVENGHEGGNVARTTQDQNAFAYTTEDIVDQVGKHSSLLTRCSQRNRQL